MRASERASNRESERGSIRMYEVAEQQLYNLFIDFVSNRHRYEPFSLNASSRLDIISNSSCVCVCVCVYDVSRNFAYDMTMYVQKTAAIRKPSDQLNLSISLRKVEHAQTQRPPAHTYTEFKLKSTEIKWNWYKIDYFAFWWNTVPRSVVSLCLCILYMKHARTHRTYEKS